LVNHRKLPLSFYRQRDALTLARDLLGCVVVVPTSDGTRVSGIIVETEAYCGVTDRASHAYGDRRTARTETMYAAGGVTYVYFVYGMHHQLNIVAGPAETPEAVLIRALEPLEGVAVMQPRRKFVAERQLTSGPGKLCAALGVDRSFDGESLRGRRIWIEPAAGTPQSRQIARGPRIGIDYAGNDVLKPWRFWLKNNVYVSRQPKRNKKEPNGV
jgi:DNA-3-methyladenine glycosylase